MKFSKFLIVLFYLVNNVCPETTFKYLKTYDKVVVCYVGSWAVYRPKAGSFQVEDIDASLCTHVIYSFASLNISGDSIRSLDSWQDLADNYGKNGYGRVVQMREKYPLLKVSLALGGWNDGSKNYSDLAADPTRRAKFVQNALQFIRKYKFDGLDIDWEFPASRGGEPYDKKNFVAFLKELHSAFSIQGLLLTAAVSAAPDTIDVAYDIPAISQYLDYIHLMCYDYHGTWDPQTGANAPLFSSDNLNVEYSIRYMLKLGAPKNKLVMGVPMYGRTFILTNSDSPTLKLGLPSQSQGFQGPFTKQSGFMGYNEICLELEKNSSAWKIEWDVTSQTPFAVNGNKVISYDNVRSIKEKVNLAQKYRLGGVMIWSIDTDDFHGDCASEGGTKGYPLLKAINSALALPPPPPHSDDDNEIPHGDPNGKKDGSSANLLVFDLNLVILPILTLKTVFW